MKVLLVGAGVVGTVFGAHLAADGHAVSVLAHGRRTHDIAARDLTAWDVESGALVESPVVVVENASNYRIRRRRCGGSQRCTPGIPVRPQR
jgi:ketopantoate reductase